MSDAQLANPPALSQDHSPEARWVSAAEDDMDTLDIANARKTSNRGSGGAVLDGGHRGHEHIER